jgi:RimJ/RimL family protein N-acetyltransferase
VIVVRGGHTERLTLEPLDERHAPGLVAALDHTDVGRFIGGPDVTTVDAVVERIGRVRHGPADGRDEQWCNWVAMIDDVVVGRVEATVHHGIAEVAYLFDPRRGGRGLATEAVAWMIGQLSEAGVEDFWAAVVPENTLSIRLLERLGFVPDDPGAIPLVSFDPGDLTFRKR